MFLATTALSDFWNKEDEILFLGKWCLRYDNRHEWEALNYHVMPYPWDDRNRMHEAAHYLDSLGEKMMEHLTQYLNAVHGISYGKRSWQLLIGYWLFHYLHVVYDRYILLKKAFECDPKLCTILLSPDIYQVPQDTHNAIAVFGDDTHNLLIFSLILQALGYCFPIKVIKAEESIRTKKTNKNNLIKEAFHSFNQNMLGLFWKMNRCGLLKQKGILAFNSMACSKYMIFRLCLKMGMQVFPYETINEWIFSLPDANFDQHRNGLAELPVSGEFESLFVALLPKSFPVLYLEAFQIAREETITKYPYIPPVIVTSLGWMQNVSGFFMAESINKGSRLAIMEHTGGYGFKRHTPQELCEERLADSFIVGGWGDVHKEKYQNLPSLYTSPVLNKYPKNQDQQDILLVTTMLYRYLLRFTSYPIGPQLEEYINWELRFVSAMPKKHHSMLLFRSYMEDYGWSVPDRIASEFPDIRFDNSNQVPYLKRLFKSRLVVTDHPSSTYLLGLSANVPSVMFWDPNLFEMKPEAESFFDKLRHAGILWHSPEEAAEKVAAIYCDPWAWWGMKEVQDARMSFISQFALPAKNWLKIWAEGLNKEINLRNNL